MFNNFKKPLFLGLIALTVANSVSAGDPDLGARAGRFIQDSAIVWNRLQDYVDRSPDSLRARITALADQALNQRTVIQRALVENALTDEMIAQAEGLLVGVEAAALAWVDVVQVHRCPDDIIVQVFEMACAIHRASLYAQAEPFGHGNGFLGMNVAELSLAVNEFLLAQDRVDVIGNLRGLTPQQRYHAEIRFMTQHRITLRIQEMMAALAARPGRRVRPRSRSRSRSGSRPRGPSGAAQGVGPARRPQSH